MKITKTQLKEIIKEEVSKLQKKAILEQEEMLVNNFKTDVERILVQKVARPNFAKGTFGSNTKSLRDMIQDLEYLITDYKAKM
tara:strand:- start:436 stop:684 length:249 start_codon:yes stop_codon:yes gene_type:complete